MIHYAVQKINKYIKISKIIYLGNRCFRRSFLYSRLHLHVFFVLSTLWVIMHAFFLSFSVLFIVPRVCRNVCFCALVSRYIMHIVINNMRKICVLPFSVNVTVVVECLIHFMKIIFERRFIYLNMKDRPLSAQGVSYKF